jgi:N-acyl-phosphatidylethanolamine-hydrolysing phospholipase D
MNLEIHTHPLYSTQHHKNGGGFYFPDTPPRTIPVLKGIQWVFKHSLRKPHGPLPPVHKTDSARLIPRPGRLRVTWIGHSTLLIQTPEVTLLTDPMFSKRASPLRFAGPDRKPSLPLRLEDLPPVDVVILSHDHYDHLDEETIRRLQGRFEPLFLAPLGVGDILKRWGVMRILELDWWQYVETENLRFHCLPAKHFSGRGVTGRDSTLWASWYVEAPAQNLRLYYAGDTAYAAHFQQIREHLGAPDVAFIPIGAYLPRWFMEPVHVNPEEAVRAFQDLGARHFIPIHWGTFDLADEWITEPIARTREHMDAQGLADKLRELAIGESWLLG